MYVYVRIVIRVLKKLSESLRIGHSECQDFFYSEYKKFWNFLLHYVEIRMFISTLRILSLLAPPPSTCHLT